jgi:hypothetical protein
MPTERANIIPIVVTTLWTTALAWVLIYSF